MSNVASSPLNWNNASKDYGAYRPGYPDDYFELLQRFGIGLPGQNILDIGSGTGALALKFARQGANVTAVDLSDGQIAEARAKAAAQNLDIRFIISGAEDAPIEENYFHTVTASMCWGYFDMQRIIDKIKRVLAPGGVLLISSIVWGDDDEVTRKTNNLLARYNPLSVRNRSVRSTHHHLLPEEFALQTFHTYVTKLPFTEESWRGRMRATKFIGAVLPAEQVTRFDAELAEILRSTDQKTFDVSHNIQINIYKYLN